MLRSVYAPTGAELFACADLVGSALAALAEALDRAAEVAPTVTLTAARTLAADQLAATGAVTPLSLERFAALWARFDRFAERGFGVKLVADVDAGVVRAFLRARTSAEARPSPVKDGRSSAASYPRPPPRDPGGQWQAVVPESVNVVPAIGTNCHV